jgi:hypothetical protein
MMSNLQLDFLPYVSWPVFALLATIGLVLVGLLFGSGMRGRFWRSVALACLLGAVANPVLRQDERDELPDIAAIIVDESDSQSLGDRKAQTETALKKLQDRVAALGNTEVRIGRYRSGTTAETDGTRLFGALDKLAADIPPERFAGAILLTDGQVHDVPSDAAVAKLRGPIHSLITGSKTEIDRRIVIDQAPRFAITNQQHDIQFHVEDSAGSAAVEVAVTLPDGTKTVTSVVPNTPQTLSLSVDRAGQNILELSVPHKDGEISDRNNRAMAMIEGIRDRLRVLLISGEPHPGERTWRNLLKADASVDLVHFTILRPPEKQDGTPTKELSLIAFPTRELFLDKINDFDLVIFDRYRRQAIVPDAYLANIADYVRRGGAVLISSGPDFASGDGLHESSLADIMAATPTGTVVEQPFRPAVTEAGLKHPVTRDLPGGGKLPTWGRWFRLIDTTTAPDATTLLSGPDDKPLLVVSHAGDGRVAQLMSDHGWLWARGYEGGGPQTELLRRVAHWLMKEPDLEEEALVAKQDGSFIAIERRTMADAAKPVGVTLPSGKTVDVPLRQIEPGVFKGRTAILETGVHRFNDGAMQTAAAIGNADAKEMSDLRATDKILAPLAAIKRSGVMWLEDGIPGLSKVSADRPMAGSGWLGLRENNQFRVTAVRELPLFSTLLSLAALLLIVPGMWYREGR